VLLCLGAVALGHAVGSQLNGARQITQNTIEEDLS
jgi:hypothetical protein